MYISHVHMHFLIANEIFSIRFSVFCYLTIKIYGLFKTRRAIKKKKLNTVKIQFYKRFFTDYHTYTITIIIMTVSLVVLNLVDAKKKKCGDFL